MNQHLITAAEAVIKALKSAIPTLRHAHLFNFKCPEREECVCGYQEALEALMLADSSFKENGTIE